MSLLDVCGEDDVPDVDPGFLDLRRYTKQLDEAELVDQDPFRRAGVADFLSTLPEAGTECIILRNGGHSRRTVPPLLRLPQAGVPRWLPSPPEGQDTEEEGVGDGAVREPASAAVQASCSQRSGLPQP
mmetsp:Transcript_16090/g.40895  ORF Transcript_16090/g.40895 Transcript_16090/m.40895 type:complete len:128 (+) Transcript_16090:467-850(+)